MMFCYSAAEFPYFSNSNYLIAWCAILRMKLRTAISCRLCIECIFVPGDIHNSTNC